MTRKKCIHSKTHGEALRTRDGSEVFHKVCDDCGKRTFGTQAEALAFFANRKPATASKGA